MLVFLLIILQNVVKV